MEATKTVVSRAELGRRLHMLRWVRDLSARQVAERTGSAISEPSLLRWERAKQKGYPDGDKLAILAGLFGVDLADLLDPDFDPRAWLTDIATARLLGWTDWAMPDEPLAVAAGA